MRLIESGAAALRPPPKLTVGEWAERNRQVPVGTSPEPGRWKSKPYQRAVLDQIGRPENKGVVYIAASQGGGKTEVLLNAAGFFIEADPAPQILVTDTIKKAEDTSKDRVAPMIRDTPCLRVLVADPKSRDSGNTILHKTYPGGSLDMVGANAPGDLASRPKRVLLVDEVDRFDESAGTEGDPIMIAQARISAFWNAVQVFVTSPGHKTLDRSWSLWEKTDKREWLVPCPDCGHEQQLAWAQVRFGEKVDGAYEPEAARYACKECGSLWTDFQRWRASSQGRYEATAPFRGWAGFRLSALAVIGRPLAQLVEKFLDAQGNPHKTKVFTNTDLTEWYEDPDAESIDAHVLQKREEDWTAWQGSGIQVPDPVVVLTMGIDVQGNRIEYEIVGWGRGEESWSIHYGVIPGDLRADPNVLAKLDQVLMKPWRHARGIDLYVRGAAMDAGYATQNVVSFTKDRLSRFQPDGYSSFLFATMGRSLPGQTVWPPLDQKRSKVGRKLVWIVNVDAAKDQIFGRLAIGEPGPGYCHFPRGRSKGYYDQLTAEQSVPHFRRGQRGRSWKIKEEGRANEALDCRVYAYSALCALQTDLFGLVLDNEAERIEALPRLDLSTAGAVQAPVQAQNPTPPRRRGVRSRGVR